MERARAAAALDCSSATSSSSCCFCLGLEFTSKPNAALATRGLTLTTAPLNSSDAAAAKQDGDCEEGKQGEKRGSKGVYLRQER